MTSMVGEGAPRSDIVALALAAAKLLAVGALVFLAQGLLGANPLGGALVGLVAVEFLGVRAGLKWDETGAASVQQLAKRGLAGFSGGAVVAVVVLVVGALAGRATLGAGHPQLMAFAIGAAMPVAQAARDELLFRGVALALLRDRVPDRFALPFTALLGAAPVVWLPTSSGVGVALVVVTGLVFAMLWRVGRGAYLAWGAHAGWLFLLGAGSRGQVVDVAIARDQLFPVASAQGGLGWIALVVAAVSAVGVALWLRRVQGG